jgi:small redox-active disulfide protein 2
MLDIKVLGSGCQNCHKLEKLCHEVVDENSLEAKIELDSDFHNYWKLGIMMTPALVVNGKVLVQGKIPTKHTLFHWLNDIKTNM